MATSTVHPSCVIDSRVKLGERCRLGPNCVLVGDITLADDVELLANVYLQGPLTIGPRTRVWPGAVLGGDPQDYKVKPGFPTAGVTIGADCLIREGVTVHAATKTDIPTRIGSRVFMMANSHAGHDAQVSDDVILVNGVLLAGHVQVHEKAVISGNTGVHQFCRVGKMAMVSGAAAIATEIPPYCMAYGRNSLAMLNVVGMRRAGISREHITIARQAYREVFRANLPRPQMIERLTELGQNCPCVMDMATFVRESKRAIAPHRAQRDATDDE
ncbi:MAG: acyl-ACP--UDP-N-acetylglucosamine O-acyltransferase [Phycisphaerales bacterium]|jgi:UDP-N-acetylglucosamine acyltransferase|nr:acyl-ACP--UDP-N-acetylglucosamine O-acyltransferase [Phycisphaerales bacterium]